MVCPPFGSHCKFVSTQMVVKSLEITIFLVLYFGPLRVDTVMLCSTLLLPVSLTRKMIWLSKSCFNAILYLILRPTLLPNLLPCCWWICWFSILKGTPVLVVQVYVLNTFLTQLLVTLHHLQMTCLHHLTLAWWTFDISTPLLASWLCGAPTVGLHQLCHHYFEHITKH